MEFMINFGVNMNNIKSMQDAMENGGTYQEVRDATL